MRLHFLKLDREFFCLQPSLARLYSAAASPLAIILFKIQAWILSKILIMCCPFAKCLSCDAFLRVAFLRYASLRTAFLRDAFFRVVSLRYAFLRFGSLRYASLRVAFLRDASLRYAFLRVGS